MQERRATRDVDTDRRTASRIPVRCEVEFLVGGVTYSATAEDLSVKGVFVATEVDVTEDSTLTSDMPTGVAMGSLTLENGVLTTAGLGSVSFTGTTVNSTTAVGLDPRIDTDYGLKRAATWPNIPTFLILVRWHCGFTDAARE